MMSRFYVKPEAVRGGKIYVDRNESHHILDVMRLRKGDSVMVFDGTGSFYKGVISSTENKRVVVDILEIKSGDRRQIISLSLAQSVPKKDKMDLIVEKATELGVSEIIPIESKRVVVKPKVEKKRQRKDRWQKKAVEASKQCGRSEAPNIKEIMGFDAMLGNVSGYDFAIIPCLSEKTVPLKTAFKNAGRPKNILVMIGPEGGFTKGEISKAEEKAAVPVSLGRLVLRSETAAIAILSILNYEYRN